MPEYTREPSRTTPVQSRVSPKLTFCIGPKGGLVVYGMGRFPVTLFLSQWEQIFVGVDPTIEGTLWNELYTHAINNEALLATKESGGTAKADDKPDDKPEITILNNRDIAAVVAYASHIGPTNPEDAVRLMTIKAFAELNKFKVPRSMGLEAMNVREKCNQEKIPY